MRKANARTHGGGVVRRGGGGGLATSAVEGLEPRMLFAVFTVTSTADAGAGSLRQAIIDSNGNTGLDSIAFAIGTGAQVIAPLSALPALTDTAGTIVDGSSQPGYAAGTPVITIDGSSAGASANGLQVQGGLSTVLGLNIQNFDGDQIEISGGGNTAVLGCVIIGTGADPSGDGISVGAPNVRIGGPAAGDRNVIGANLSQAGISVAAAGVGAIIENNIIGANAAGTAATPNGTGILVTAADGVTVIANLISGNTGDGVTVTGSADDIIIRGNRIGTDANGTADLGNGSDGIALTNTAGVGPSGAQIGSTASPNIIAFNDAAGIAIPGSGTGNAISGNSIFSNTGLGIDLGTAGRTANDAGDADTGANNLQNFPSLSQAVLDTGGSLVSGTLNSGASTAYRVEFFSSPSGGNVADGEGKTFLGATSVTTNSAGAGSFNFNTAAITNGLFVTATATDPDGNTSEFSDAVNAGQPGPDIRVLGNGVEIANADDEPAAGDLTDFGSAAVNSGTVTRTFTINNAGGGSLAFTGGVGAVTIGGANASQFSLSSGPSGPLGASGSTTFQITFTPTAAGTQEAVISIASNDPDENPFTFTVLGAGTTAAPAPEVEVRGNGLSIANNDVTPRAADFTDFGTSSIGTPSPVSRTFVIANAGQQTLNLGVVSLGGSAASQFSITSQPGTIVAPGQQTTFTVQFAPTVGGRLTAEVSFTSNDSDETPYRFAITGVGLSVVDAAPTAALLPQDQQPTPAAGASTFDLIVRYSDDLGLVPGSFDNGDLLITGPNGFSQAASFLSIQNSSATQADVVYRVTAPGGQLRLSDEGNYTVNVLAGQVLDNGGNSVAAGPVGTFALDINGNGLDPAGTFGLVAGRRVKLSFTETDGTLVTLSLSSGTGQLFFTNDGRIDLNVTSNNGKLTVKTNKAGNGRAEMHNVRVTGSLAALTAKTADVDNAGVITSTSGLGAVSLGSLNGATISTTGNLAGLTVAGNVASTLVFAGANLGADGLFGGTGADADTFAGGSLNKLSVTGTITQSLFAAGLDPTDDQLLNGNGLIVGGASSAMKSIKAKGPVDASTRFAAGAFPKSASLGGQKVDPLADPHFDSTP